MLSYYPAKGEGRNAVFAASNGWRVNAFDSSEAGKKKALQLAHKKRVNIEYVVEDALAVNYPANSADVVAFIYAHFPPATRKVVLQKAITWLKPGGKIILEAFNPNQLQNSTGGPKDVSMLYTEDIIREEFGGMKIELIQTLRTELSEGKYHEGISDIVRFVGIKK